MTVLHSIIEHCETLMRTQSGTEWLRSEIGKIRDLAQSGLEKEEWFCGPMVLVDIDSIEPTHSVTPSPIASHSDVERHLDADETPE